MSGGTASSDGARGSRVGLILAVAGNADGTPLLPYAPLLSCLGMVRRANRGRSAPPEAGSTRSHNHSRERSR